MDLKSFWHEQAGWSQKTFGKDKERGPIGPLKHLKKEVDEVLANRHDLEEYADLLFLVFDATRRAGFGFDDLLGACYFKLAKNRRRSWPAPTPGDDEPVEHVREEAPSGTL